MGRGAVARLESGFKRDGLPRAAGADTAVQRQRGEARGQRGRVHAVQPGLQVPACGVDRVGAGAPVALGVQTPACDARLQRAHRGAARLPEHVGLQGLHGQLLAIPGAGLGIRQIGVESKALGGCGLRAELEITAEAGVRGCGPQAGQIQCLQRPFGLGQGLRGPGKQARREACLG